jgi:hypothetical protein
MDDTKEGKGATGMTDRILHHIVPGVLYRVAPLGSHNLAMGLLPQQAPRGALIMHRTRRDAAPLEDRRANGC